MDINTPKINTHKANMIVVSLALSLNDLLVSKRNDLHQGALVSLIGRTLFASFDFKHCPELALPS